MELLGLIIMKYTSECSTTEIKHLEIILCPTDEVTQNEEKIFV